jgi:hypothetical protein
MTTDRLVEEFFEYEVDDYVRTQLRDAAAGLATGNRYFTYNAFNVRLDADSGTATIEDEMDVSREVTLELNAFLVLLASKQDGPGA